MAKLIKYEGLQPLTCRPPPPPPPHNIPSLTHTFTYLTDIAKELMTNDFSQFEISGQKDTYLTIMDLMCLSVCVCVCVCVFGSMGVCLDGWVCMWVDGWVGACVHAYVHVYMYD